MPITVREIWLLHEGLIPELGKCNTSDDSFNAVRPQPAIEVELKQMCSGSILGTKQDY